MKLYKVKAQIHTHSWMDGQPRPEPEIVEEYHLIDDRDDIDEFIQMCYGCWYDIKVLSIEQIDEEIIHLSKNLMRTHAREIIDQIL